MMSEELETLLIQCLDELEAGVALEEILLRHPAEAAQLRPFLLVAGRLSELAPTPPAQAQAASHELFLAQAAAIRRAGQTRPRLPFWSRRLGLALASLLVVCVAILGLVQGAAEALPGDVLYPVKRARENVQLALTDDPAAISELRHTFNDERVREVKGLLASGRNGEVTCEARVEAMQADALQVYGVDLYLDSATQVLGRPSVGDTIVIRGRVENGRFIAAEIIVEEEAQEEETAPETPTEPTPTPTPAVTPTHFPAAPATTPELDDNSGDEGNMDGQDGNEERGVGNEDDDDDDNSGSGNGDDDDDDDDDNSGSVNGGDDDDDDDDNSGSGNGDDDDDDNSGSGNGDDDDDDDNSGSGNGGDDDDDDDDNSGSGNGDDDDDDNSGSGNGDDDDDDDNSGSGNGDDDDDGEDDDDGDNSGSG